MAVQELFEGREQVITNDGPTVRIAYYVTDVADEDAAIAAVAAATSTYRTFAGYRLKRTTITLVELVTVDPSTSWRAQVEYTKVQNTDEGMEPSRSFSTTGGTAHITQSLETLDSLGDKAVDHQRAIGFDGENVAGTDVVVPTFNFEETQYFADDDVTPAYVGGLFRLTGKINNDDVTVPKIGNFRAGEMLFLGASGRWNEKDEVWEITFQFSCLPNVEDWDVNGTITVPEKRGWDYVWFRYGAAAETADDGKTVRIPVIESVYVERVYDEGDFTDLGMSGWTT